MRLLSTLRQKKRYLLVEVLSEARFSFSEVREGVEQALVAFLGQLGMARAAPMLLSDSWQEKKQRFTLKVNRNAVDEVKAALTLSKKIKNTSIIFRSMVTSGALKKIRSQDLHPLGT